MIANLLERVPLETLQRLHQNRFVMRESGQVSMEQSDQMMLQIGQETMRRIDNNGIQHPPGFDDNFARHTPDS